MTNTFNISKIEVYHENYSTALVYTAGNISQFDLDNIELQLKDPNCDHYNYERYLPMFDRYLTVEISKDSVRGFNIYYD